MRPAEVAKEHGDDADAEELGLVTPQRCYILSVPEGPDVPEKVSETKRERLGITRNKVRNRLIREVVDEVPADKQLIIFVRTIEHIEELMKEYLPEGFEFYHAQIPQKEKNRIEAGLYSGEIKRVVANDSLSEGVDTTMLDYIIDAAWNTSDVSVSQKGGRNRRLREGKKFGILVNFADEWGEILRTARNQDAEFSMVEVAVGDEKVNHYRRRALSRIGRYRARDWPIIEISSPKEIQWVEEDEPKVGSQMDLALSE